MAARKTTSRAPRERHRDVDVLVVDSDRAARAELESVLRSAGFVVKGAPSSLHAIQVLEREHVRLVIAEERMQTGLDGLGLVVLVKSRWPSVRRLVMARRTTGELVMQAKVLADARTFSRALAEDKIVALVKQELRAFA